MAGNSVNNGNPDAGGNLAIPSSARVYPVSGTNNVEKPASCYNIGCHVMLQPRTRVATRRQALDRLTLLSFPQTERWVADEIELAAVLVLLPAVGQRVDVVTLHQFVEVARCVVHRGDLFV